MASPQPLEVTPVSGDHSAGSWDEGAEEIAADDLLETQPEDEDVLVMLDYKTILANKRKHGYLAYTSFMGDVTRDARDNLVFRNRLRFLLREFEPNETHTGQNLRNPQYLLKRLKAILENYQEKFKLFEPPERLLRGSHLSAAIVKSQPKVADLVYYLENRVLDSVRTQCMFLEREQECVQEISDLLEKERQLIAALKEVPWDAPEDGVIVKAARSFVEAGRNLTMSCSEDLEGERIRKDNLIQEIIKLTNDQSRFQDDRWVEYHLAATDEENKKKLYEKIYEQIENRLKGILDNKEELSELVNIWIRTIDNLFQPNAHAILHLMNTVPLVHTELAKLRISVSEDKRSYDSLRRMLNSANQGTHERGDTIKRKEQELQRITEAIRDIDIEIDKVSRKVNAALKKFSVSPIQPVRPTPAIRPESSPPPPRASSPIFLRSPVTPEGVVSVGGIGIRDLQYIDEELSPEIFRKGSPGHFPRSDPLMSSPVSLDSTQRSEQSSFSHDLPSPIDIRSPSPVMQYDKNAISPIAGPSNLPLDLTFDASSPLPMNRTFDTSPAPVRDRTFDASPPPPMNRTFDRSPAPVRDRTFDASSPLPMNRTFDASPAPARDRTFDASPVPTRGRTFGASSSPPMEALYSPNQFVTPFISKFSRHGYTDKPKGVLNIPPDLKEPTPLKQSILLTSPKGKSFLVDIDIDPKPLTETRSGERFICDISLDLRDPGQQKRGITPVSTYGMPPEVTPPDSRRYGLATPKGMLKKKDFYVRRLFEPEEYQSPSLPWSTTHLSEDARSHVGLFPPSPDFSDRSISWEKSPPHVLDRTFAPSTPYVMDRTFPASPITARDRTFDSSLPPLMDRTFDASSVPARDRTFDASSPHPMNRTFDASSPLPVNRTFGVSPISAGDKTFGRSSPYVNRTFGATFDASSPSPIDSTFGASPTPATGRTFDASSPHPMGRTFDTYPYPSRDNTFDASSPFPTDRTFDASPVPSRDRTFDASSPHSSDRSHTSSSATSGDRTFDSSSLHLSDISPTTSPASFRDNTFNTSFIYPSDR